MTREPSATSAASRRGYSLMELAVASAVGSMVVGALGGAVVLASSALPASGSSATGLLETSEALGRIAGELEQGLYVSAPNARHVRIVLPDRDSDGAPELIGYSWSSTSGDPLWRTDDGLVQPEALGDVRSFAVALSTTQSTETYSGAQYTVTQIVDSLASYIDVGEPLDIKALDVHANAIQLALPANCISWRPTEVSLYGRKNDILSNDKMAVQIRTRQNDGRPTETVIGEVILSEVSLPLFDGWFSGTFDSATGEWASATGDYCLLVGCTGKSGTAAVLRREKNMGVGMWEGDVSDSYWSSKGESIFNWNFAGGKELLFRLTGECLVQEADGTVTWRRVVLADVGADSGGYELQRLTRIVNTPYDVSTFWDANFASDPTVLDLNADGQPDWATRSGSPFESDDLIGGLLAPSQNLVARPQTNLTAPTIVEAEWRQSKTGAAGGAMRIAADQGDGRQAILQAQITRPDDSTQRVVISYRDDSGAYQELATHDVDHTGFVQMRLLVLPDINAINLRVDGSEIGSFRYQRRVYSASEQETLLIQPGDGMEVDSVRVLVGAGS